MKNKKFVSYKLVFNTSAVELEHAVNMFIREGYELFGNPFCRTIPISHERYAESIGRSYIYQAIVLYENQKKA